MVRKGNLISRDCLRGDDDIVAVQSIEHGRESVCARRAGACSSILASWPVQRAKSTEPCQRPVDAGRGNFDLVVAFDRIFGLDEIEQRMGKLAQPSTSMLPSGRSAMICRVLCCAAHDAQTHQPEARSFDHGFKHRFQMRCRVKMAILQIQNLFPAAVLRPPHNRSCCLGCGVCRLKSEFIQPLRPSHPWIAPICPPTRASPQADIFPR